MSRPYEPTWTALEEAQLRILNGQGKSDREAGLIMGKGRSAISHRRRLLGLPRVGGAGAGRVRWTPERDALLTRLWADRRLTTIMIGQQLGVSPTSIKERARKLNLPSRAPKPAERVLDNLTCEKEEPDIRRARIHGEKCLAAGGFPAMSERLVYERGNRRVWACKLPLVWPVDRRAA